MKANILLIGSGITQDKMLLQRLQEFTNTTLLNDSEKLIQMVKDHTPDLLVFEFSETWELDLQIIQSLKVLNSKIPIIVVDGGETKKAVIHSFRFGAKDYFKKPYKPLLLAERVEALLKKKKKELLHY